jgi:hypothetical protein
MEWLIVRKEAKYNEIKKEVTNILVFTEMLNFEKSYQKEELNMCTKERKYYIM